MAFAPPGADAADARRAGGGPHRPYRPGLPPDAALEELKTGAGSIYDARAAKARIAVTQNGFTFRD